MFKLNPLVYVVVGVVLSAIVFFGFWFLKIDPTRAEIGFWEEHNSKLDTIISPASRTAAENRLKDALTKVREAETSWKLIAQRRTPSSAQINLVPHRWQTVVDTRRWHSRVEADLRAWMGKSGVRLIAPTPIVVPFPTDNPNQLIQDYFNYPAFKFPIAIWDLGTFTVEGTYDQIMNHIRNWRNIPNYIAQVRGLGIEGTGNRLRGTYGLTLIAYINTEYISGGPGEGGGVPDISGSSQQGGAGGSGGGGATPGGRAGPGGATAMTVD